MNSKKPTKPTQIGSAPADPGSPSLGSRVEAVCEDFEREWRDGNAPKISEFVDGNWDDDSLQMLLKELVSLDIEYRAKRGDSIDPAEYIQQVPKPELMALVVDDLFMKTSSLQQFQDTPVNHLPDTAAPTTGSSEALEHIPESIGDYRILNVIAIHGQGIVYRADHPRLNRQVVIKASKCPLNEMAQQAVFDEGHALATLSHPNIAQIYDLILDDDGCPCLVMEYIDGRNLAERQVDVTMEPIEAADLVQTLANAMSTAHENGIVHRDLKPANVVIRSADNVPKIIDFGLARARTAFSTEAESSTYGGTVAFMAPEQAAWLLSGMNGNDPTSDRTDIYALGAILFVLLTGQSPYTFETQTEGLEKVASGELDHSLLGAPAIPTWLRDVAIKTLSKDPKDRYSSAAELANSLNTPPTRPKWTLAVVACVMILCAYGIYSFMPSKPNQPVDDKVESDEIPLVATVTHFEREGEEAGESGELMSLGPPRLNDDVRWDVEFGEKFYAYLIALNPDGAIQKCFPPDASEAQESPITELHYPSDSGSGFGLTDGVGQQAFLLIVQESPLPPLDEWLATNEIAWNPIPESGKWVWENGKISAWRNLTRGDERELAGKSVFQGICESIERDHPDITVYGLSFEVVKERKY